MEPINGGSTTYLPMYKKVSIIFQLFHLIRQIFIFLDNFLVKFVQKRIILRSFLMFITDQYVTSFIGIMAGVFTRISVMTVFVTTLRTYR